jgi:hypothetical protein
MSSVFITPGSAAGATVLSGLTEIDSRVISVATPTIEFANIPQTFRALRCVTYLRDDGGSTNASETLIRFNGDSGANYDREEMIAGGTSAVSGAGGVAQTAAWAVLEGGGASPANRFGTGELVVPGYATVGNFKNVFGNTCYLSSTLADCFIGLLTGLWRNTAAINDLQLVAAGGANFVAGSVATLYGML